MAEPHVETGTDPQATAECPPVGPGPEHERFGDFVGTFRSEVRMWMDPTSPEPFTSTGTMVNELDLGGRFLRHTYAGDQVDGPFPSFEGRGFWGYNAAAERWEGFWIDNVSTGMDLERGQLEPDGRTWIMHSTFVHPATGAEQAKRTEIVLQDRDHHRMTTWFTQPDGSEFKVMQIDYTRAS